jgi:mannitol/fructose-specific phosphotransferase system IIA component (Ntr-type)
LLLRLELLVKVASTVLILLFVFANLTLIMFRESKLFTYRPKFSAPLYPYLQIAGVLAGIFLLIEMGSFVVFLTFILLSLGVIWYKAYAEKRGAQHSALIHVLEKLVAKDKELSTESLLTELRDIVIQRDDIVEDRFQRLVSESVVLDIEEPLKIETLFRQIAAILSKDLGVPSEDLYNKFYEREMNTSTVVRDGLAIPHIVYDVEDASRLILVRARTGIVFPQDKLVHVAFVLVGSAGRHGRSLHLRDLVAIAEIARDPNFDKKWLDAKDEEELRSIILLADRSRSP